MTRGRIFLWTVALLLFACAGTAPNILHVQAGPGGLSSKKEEINDRWLARNIAFGEVSVRPLGSDSSMESQVMIENETSGDVFFEYRFIWYDAAGFELSPITAWIPGSLSAREARPFKSTAPGPNAVRFDCMVRKVHAITHTGTK